jgi:hypothetical protein
MTTVKPRGSEEARGAHQDTDVMPSGSIGGNLDDLIAVVSTAHGQDPAVRSMQVAVEVDVVGRQDPGATGVRGKVMDLAV